MSEMKDKIEDLGQYLPEEMTTSDLAALIMTIMHAYIDVDEVPKFLLALSKGAEQDADRIKELLKDVGQDES